MSDEFDSLDASEKDAKRPSDDVVQTAPVKCRYTKSGLCANIAGFCLCRQANFDLPSSHDARTGKSASRRAWPAAGELATLKIMLRRLRAEGLRASCSLRLRDNNREALRTR